MGSWDPNPINQLYLQDHKIQSRISYTHQSLQSDPDSPTAATTARSNGRGNKPARSFHAVPCWRTGRGWRRPAGRIWRGCFQRDLWTHDIGGVAVFVMARSADASVRMTEPPGSNGISCTPPWASNMAFPALDANLNLRLLPWMRLPMRLLQFADGHSQIALRGGDRCGDGSSPCNVTQQPNEPGTSCPHSCAAGLYDRGATPQSAGWWRIYALFLK